MKKRAGASFAVHVIWAVAYLVLVILKISLGIYILEIFNLIVASISHFLHFQWFQEYTSKGFLVAQFIQFVASIWKLIQEINDLINYDTSRYESFGLSIASAAILCVGIYSNYNYLKRTYFKLPT